MRRFRQFQKTGSGSVGRKVYGPSMVWGKILNKTNVRKLCCMNIPSVQCSATTIITCAVTKERYVSYNKATIDDVDGTSVTRQRRPSNKREIFQEQSAPGYFKVPLMLSSKYFGAFRQHGSRDCPGAIGQVHYCWYPTRRFQGDIVPRFDVANAVYARLGFVQAGGAFST
jgi:hypothetical protein